MEGYEGGDWLDDDEEPKLRLLRNQKAEIEARKQKAVRDKYDKEEIARLRREIKAEGEKPCA